MAIKFANNAVGTLASSASAPATTLSLAAGQGALFPSLTAGDYFYLTIGLPGSTEIVKVTARTVDSLTVIRAQESTTALVHAVGTPARLLITAAGLVDLNQLAAGAANQIPYTTGAGATSFITAPTVSSSVLSWNGTAFAWATGGATISDDTTTAATYYPTFSVATSGALSTVKVSSSKLTFNPSTGVLTSTTVTSSSDESLKTDWQDLASDFVDRLAQAKHGVFTRIAEGTVEAGVSAQDWQTVLPQTVVKGNNGLLSVNYGGAALVSAIQLAKRLVALEATVAKLGNSKETL
jgi:hypothetical protein